MKLDESKSLVLLASVILGFLLASQVNFGSIIPREILTFQNYQQISSEIDKLTDEINVLNEKKNEMEFNLLKYINTGESDSQKIIQFEEELKKYDFYAGLTDVKGPGVIISLDDNPITGNYTAPEEILLGSIVHDEDVRRIVWELRNEGAEAISINGQRMMNNTEFYCEGPIITVNKVKLAPPYIIKVIGDPEKLLFVLNSDDGWYKYMESRGLLVSKIKEDSVNILRYNDNVYYSYMKRVKEE